MAELLSIKGYKNEGSTIAGNYTGYVIGYYSNARFERVYGIRIRSTGATELSITLKYDAAGNTSRVYYAVINQDAGMYTANTGGVSSDGVQGVFNTGTQTLTFTVPCNMIGGQTYYVHIFTSTASAGNYINVMQTEAKVESITESGVYGGLVIIYTPNRAVTIPYVWTGGAWHQCLGYVGHDSVWNMGVC